MADLPVMQKQAFSKRRFALVQQLPRLCFALSDIIMYVRFIELPTSYI